MATAGLSISVLGITTSSLPAAAARVPYSAPLETAGWTGTLSWAISSGALPAGLRLSQDGTITGTPTPTAAGHSAFTVMVTDSAAPPQMATAEFTIDVAREPVEVPRVPEGHAEARHTLTNLGLAVSDEVMEAISDKPARTVVGTDPPGGSLVAPATMITLVVSNTTEVPPVVGAPAEAAEEMLINAGFRVTAHMEGKAGGRLMVRSQTPEGGSRVPRHSNVSLVLAAPEYEERAERAEEERAERAEEERAERAEEERAEREIAPSRARGQTGASTETKAGRKPRSSRPAD
jgi:Putative Ig domain/PASTA domain